MQYLNAWYWMEFNFKSCICCWIICCRAIICYQSNQPSDFLSVSHSSQLNMSLYLIPFCIYPLFSVCVQQVIILSNQNPKSCYMDFFEQACLKQTQSENSPPLLLAITTRPRLPDFGTLITTAEQRSQTQEQFTL